MYHTPHDHTGEKKPARGGLGVGVLGVTAEAMQLVLVLVLQAR